MYLTIVKAQSLFVLEHKLGRTLVYIVKLRILKQTQKHFCLVFILFLRSILSSLGDICVLMFLYEHSSMRHIINPLQVSTQRFETSCIFNMSLPLTCCTINLTTHNFVFRKFWFIQSLTCYDQIKQIFWDFGVVNVREKSQCDSNRL